jgi:hypothetical protein
LIRARRIPHRLLLDSISTLTPVGARGLPARRCPRTRWSLLTTAHRACRASYRRSPVPGVVTGAGRPIPNPQPMLGWGPFGESFDARSAQRRAFNRCKAGLRALVVQAIGIWLLPGRCAAGGGCCSGSGTSAGPPARWSASAGSCTGSRRRSIADTLIGLKGSGRPMRLLPSSGTTGRPGRLGYVVRHHPLGCTFQAPQAALAVDWRAHVADPGERWSRAGRRRRLT